MLSSACSVTFFHKMAENAIADTREFRLPVVTWRKRAQKLHKETQKLT